MIQLPNNFAARVLLVEDNKLNQKVASILLRDLGCDVDVVSSGVDAISSLKNHTYDIVFMDVGLPDIDGLSVTNQVREEFDKLELPVVALTAHSMDEKKLESLRVAMNDVLIKPVSIESLKAMLKKWVVEKESSCCKH